uniref:Thioredoxin domain-containing protein n=1 Tax=Glossina brevipalpis TaxID=37001 RepID=A0A1A9W2Q9_9MUSC
MNIFSSFYMKFFLIISGLLCASALIEQVDDTDLVHLITGKDNVIVLFTKDNCVECEELQVVVENIQNELKETIGAVVVKVHNSHMVNLYDSSKEPSLIYFRRGIPLLYFGENKEDEIVHLFTENQEPVVKELSDENFEHLTQAGSGATTGDWFVFFYSTDCVFCLRLHAVWEAVGARLKRRLNVARVDRLGAGISTAKRFRIVESPEFIFLRQGKVFRYTVKDYTPGKLIEFAETGYRRQTHPETVPPEANSINNFFAAQLQALANNPQLLMMASVAIGTFALIIVVVKILAKKKSAKVKKAAKSK